MTVAMCRDHWPVGAHKHPHRTTIPRPSWVLAKKSAPSPDDPSDGPGSISQTAPVRRRGLGATVLSLKQAPWGQGIHGNGRSVIRQCRAISSGAAGGNPLTLSHRRVSQAVTPNDTPSTKKHK